MSLRATDYEQVLELVGDVHDAQDTAELRAMVLEALVRLTPADFVSYNEMFADGRPPGFLIEPGVPAALEPVWARLGFENPLLHRYLRTRDGRPYRFSDVVSARELHAMPLFREFYRPLGIEHQIAFALPAPRDLTIAIALSRARIDFSDRERQMLDLVRPHIIQAYRNAQFREQGAQLMAAIAAGLDLGTLALVVCEDERIVYASTAARALWNDLGWEAPALEAALPEAVRSAFAGDATTASLSTDDDVLLLRRAHPRAGATTIIAERAGAAVSADTLRSLGLTPRESDVLAMLARGRDTGAVATALRISPRTAQKHLQRVYAKLGVTGRAQAVSTAWAAAGTTASLPSLP
jgi:DNA-binding CsgD family transcriptional regulator